MSSSTDHASDTDEDKARKSLHLILHITELTEPNPTEIRPAVECTSSLVAFLTPQLFCRSILLTKIWNGSPCCLLLNGIYHAKLS